jgi:fatty acid desaturase
MSESETNRSADDARRKLAARRNNERIKLLITSINTIALTTVGAAAILPLIGGTIQTAAWYWIVLAVCLHLTAHGLFRFLRSED